MRRTAVLFGVLAAVAAASPGRQHQPHGHPHQPHGHPYPSACTTTVTKAEGTVTSTVYTGTSSTTTTLTTGTATTTLITTMTTTILPTITSCAAPTADNPTKRWLPDHKPTPPYNQHQCWTTSTVTVHRSKTTFVSTESTTTVASTVAETTTTITSTASTTTSISALANLAGPFIITDQTGQNGFFDDNESNGAETEDFIALFPLDMVSDFTLVAGALTVVPGGAGYDIGDTLYTDPGDARLFFNTDTVQGFATPPTGTNATKLSCSVLQNPVDGTCPLTCTGGEGSQFYSCGGEDATVQLGPSVPPGTCASAADYSQITAYVVLPAPV